MDNSLYEACGLTVQQGEQMAATQLMLYGAQGDDACRIDKDGNALWFAMSWGSHRLVAIAPIDSPHMAGIVCCKSSDLYAMRWPDDWKTTSRVRMAAKGVVPPPRATWDEAQWAWRKDGSGKGVMLARVVRQGGEVWLEMGAGAGMRLSDAGGEDVWFTCALKHSMGLKAEFDDGRCAFANYRFMCIRAGRRARNAEMANEKAARGAAKSGDSENRTPAPTGVVDYEEKKEVAEVIAPVMIAKGLAIMRVAEGTKAIQAAWEGVTYSEAHKAVMTLLDSGGIATSLGVAISIEEHEGLMQLFMR